MRQKDRGNIRTFGPSKYGAKGISHEKSVAGIPLSSLFRCSAHLSSLYGMIAHSELHYYTITQLISEQNISNEKRAFNNYTTQC